MRCSRKQGELVVVAVRAARQHEFVAARQGLRVRRGDRADQEPGVEITERRRHPSGRWSGTPANNPCPQRLQRLRHRTSTTIASPGCHAGRASTRCGSPRSPHTSAAWAVIVAAYGCVASTTASHAGVAQPLPHSLDAAEPADAHRSDRQRRVGHPPGQRADHVDVVGAGASASARASAVPPSSKHPHQCAALPGPASAPPRPVEYR